MPTTQQTKFKSQSKTYFYYSDIFIKSDFKEDLKRVAKEYLDINSSVISIINPQNKPVSNVKKEEPKPEPVPEPEPQTEAEPEKQPEQEPQPEPKETESKPVEPAPAPKKKKKVVRVNREVLSLERTLTVSVVDALRVAMTRCWVIDTKRPDITDIRAVAHLTMRKNGTVRDVWFESAARADDDPAFAYVLETIRSAIDTCQPFRMLPENEFDKWQKIQLTFYPTQGKVM